MNQTGAKIALRVAHCTISVLNLTEHQRKSFMYQYSNRHARLTAHKADSAGCRSLSLTTYSNMNGSTYSPATDQRRPNPRDSSWKPLRALNELSPPRRRATWGVRL